MSTALPAMQALTQRLLALEAVHGGCGGQGCAAVRVCNKLRGLLANLVGNAGFESLLSRALALAKVNTPALASVRVAPDGSLTGFDDLHDGGRPDGPGAALVSQLLALLVAFVGERLTLQLVGDAWPEAGGDAERPRTQERP